jgi:predicted ester cyclase
MLFRYLTSASSRYIQLDDAEARLFLEKAFETLFDPKSTEKDVLEFFSPRYKQDLNGKVYTFRQFLDSLAELKKQLKSTRIRFTSVVSSGDKIAEVHVVRGLKKDGSTLKFKVMAFQTVEKGRIVKVEEVNCPL